MQLRTGNWKGRVESVNRKMKKDGLVPYSPPSVVMLHSAQRKVQCSTPAAFVLGVRRYVVRGVRREEMLTIVNQWYILNLCKTECILRHLRYAFHASSLVCFLFFELLI